MKSLQLKNFVGASAFRLLSIVFSLVSVPLLLHHLGAENYGTWVTLSSILMYAALLDLGIGSSLRNSIASRSSPHGGKTLESELRASFWMLAAVSLICIAAIGFTLLARRPEHAVTILVLYVPVALSIPFLLSSSILAGIGAFVAQSLFQSASVWCFICIVGILALFGSAASLVRLGAIWGIFFLLFAVSGFIYSIKRLGFNLKALLSLRHGLKLDLSRFVVGAKFLVLQISVVFLYGLGNILTYNALGPQQAARFDVCNKVFQLGMSFYGIWITIMWTEISKAKSFSDSKHLRRAFFRMHLVALVFSAGVLCAALLAPNVISMWTRGAITLQPSEALPFAFQAIVQAIAYVGAVFLNAFEDILIQVLLSIFSIILIIPFTNILFSMYSAFWVVPLASAFLTLIPLVVCNFKALVRIEGIGKGEAIV